MNKIQEFASIAQFMGYRITAGGMIASIEFGSEVESVQNPLNLRYNEDWNVLMPVIEKISALNLPDPDGVSEHWQPFPRTFGMINDDNGNFMFRFNRYAIHESKNLIDAAYSAVVEFIKFY